MRRAITVISFILSGASVLIFILALLIPMLRETPSQAVKSETEAYEALDSVEKTSAELEPEHTQSPAANNEIQASITPPPAEVKQIQSSELTTADQPAGTPGFSPGIAPNKIAIAQNRDASGAIQSPPNTPEATIPQIDEKSTGPENPTAAAENRSAQDNPMALLVLGDGAFPSGEVTPNANVQAAIDQIIPMIKARPQDKVLVEGHADKWLPGGVSPAQASKWNKVISFLRADAVAKMLKKKGVDSDRIIVKGLGDAVPIASNRTRAGRSKNRRVEIKLSPAQE